MIYSKIEGGIGCEGRVDLQQGLIAPPPPLSSLKKKTQLQSSHHKVMLTWELMPKSNYCIIPMCLEKMQ